MLRVEVNEVAQDALMHMSPIDVSPQACEEFNLWNYEALYKSKAPILFGIIQVLCCVPSAVKDIRQVDIGEPLLDVEREDEEEDMDPEIDQPDNHDGEYLWEKVQADTTSSDHRSSRKKRRPRPKALMSVMCMSVLMAARTLHNNGITGRLGIFCRAMKVPKVMHQFLNTIGFCTAYQTSGLWLRENAASDRLSLAKKFRDRPIGICWDNLVRFDKKAEPTVLNPGNKIQQNTSALMFTLHIPPPKLNSPISDFIVHSNIMRAIPANDTHSSEYGHQDGVNGTLPADLMFLPVDYDSIAVHPRSFLEKDLISAHIPLIAADLVRNILNLLCGPEALNKFQLDGQSIKRPDVSEVAKYLVLDPFKSEFHTCPTMDLDETTLDGTAEVYEKLLEYVNIQSTALNGRVVLSYGDLLTCRNLSSLKEMRIRESQSDRLEFACPKAAFFHMSMANVDAVMRCNWGKSGSYDPSSLARFAAVLGRSGITEETGDFNARFRLIDHVLSGYVAAALMTQAIKLAKGLSELLKIWLTGLKRMTGELWWMGWCPTTLR